MSQTVLTATIAPTEAFLLDYTKEELEQLQQWLYEDYPELSPTQTQQDNIHGEIAEMYKNRYTVRQIADNVGLSKSQVHRVIHMEKYSEGSGYEGWDELLATAKFNKRYKFCPRSKWLKSWL